MVLKGKRKLVTNIKRALPCQIYFNMSNLAEPAISQSRYEPMFSKILDFTSDIFQHEKSVGY